MKVIGIKTVLVADLKANLFVRKKLDHDHVLALAELIEAGVEMKDLIEVTEDNSVVEGRHRREAYELASVKEVKVRVLKFDNEAEMIAYAYKANTGGALPPTRDDTEHTVMLLLSHNEPIRRIAELLALPPSITRKYVGSIKSKTARQVLSKAAAAVTDGNLTVAKAAEQFDVEPEKLKEVLSGNRRKQKKGIGDMQRDLTALYKSVGSKNAAFFRRLMEKHEDGDVTERQVLEIFDHIESLQKQAARTLRNWRERFAASKDRVGKAGKAAKAAA